MNNIKDWMEDFLFTAVARLWIFVSFAIGLVVGSGGVAVLEVRQFVSTPTVLSTSTPTVLSIKVRLTKGLNNNSCIVVIGGDNESIVLNPIPNGWEGQNKAYTKSVYVTPDNNVVVFDFKKRATIPAFSQGSCT